MRGATASMIPDERRLVLRSDLRELPRMVRWIDGFAARASLSEETTFRLQLCLEEAVSNVIRHGLAPGASQEIVLTLDAAADQVTAQIEDDGKPFDPTAAPMPPRGTTLETVRIGGLGLHLLRRFTSALRYDRVDGRNRLCLSFARGGPARP
jgi:anti-sigma regulatory factor (Ser/Thr protein kinase)